MQQMYPFYISYIDIQKWMCISDTKWLSIQLN